MSTQTRAKLERIVEAVRHGLEGDAAVDFVRNSGYAMSSSGIARHLKRMGGRGCVLELVNAGRTNAEVSAECLPHAFNEQRPAEPPAQGELFASSDEASEPHGEAGQFETRRIALRVPEHLYEAIRLAAKAEDKTQNALIVEILTSALGRMPNWTEKDLESE